MRYYKLYTIKASCRNEADEERESARDFGETRAFLFFFNYVLVNTKHNPAQQFQIAPRCLGRRSVEDAEHFGKKRRRASISSGAGCTALQYDSCLAALKSHIELVYEPPPGRSRTSGAASWPSRPASGFIWNLPI